jgi:hypothetical protein
MTNQAHLEVCPLCGEPLLDGSLFYIDQHHNGVHDSCEESRLKNEAAEDALRAEAGLG